jgi:glycogen debranching enzyme
VHAGRGTTKILQTLCVIALFQAGLIAQTKSSPSQFPPYLADDFDYASFTRFDAPAPPKSLIYQSNGFMALQESGFGGQKIIIPVAGPAAPVNEGERLTALEIDSPVFVDDTRRTFRLSDPSARHSLSYFADRSTYTATFDNGLKVSIIVYPVYGKAAAVVRTVVENASKPVTAIIQVRGAGFQVLPGADSHLLRFGSSKWPYRLLLAGEPQNPAQGGHFEWKLASGTSAALMIALGGDEPQANGVLAEVRSSPDLFDAETHRLWNEYLASAPLVAPAQPIQFTIGTSNKQESIAPEELVRSELWFWRGVLNTTCQVRYLPACPIVIADWNVFMGMWSNDGIAETLALMGTNRTDIARASLLAWFRYAVNAKGDGTLPWTIFPSGKNTFQARGPERDTQGIPVQATLVGEYVRLTGDKSILAEKPGGFAGDRTVWEALLAYQRNLLKVRDTNHDHMIDWLNTYETGWDDKDSPFVDLKGHPTSAINEQVFNLWNLQDMVYLSKLQGEDPAPWQKEFSRAQEAIRNKLWDSASERYWDLDVQTGKLWKQGENLDAYYLLYFETDRARIDAMMKRLNDPAKFNGALLPTLAFDTPHWGGYWRGPAWPRIFGYIGMALARSGHVSEGFDWLSRAISSNLGPLLPENVDPKAYPPGEHAIGSVRIMGYDALDTLLLPDVAGLRTWAGEDLVVAPTADLGHIFVRNQKWMGDRYDAIFDPGQATLLWRNREALDPLPADRIWHAHKTGSKVTFEAQ